VVAAAGAVGASLRVLAAGSTPWPGAAGESGAGVGLTLVAALVVAAVLAQHFPVVLAPGHMVVLPLSAVFFATVLLCEPALAVPIVGLSQLLGQATLALRRNPATGRRRRGARGAAFNTAQAVLAAGTGSLTYSLLRPAAPAGYIPAGPEGLLAAGAAAAAMFLVNTGAVATMVALQRGGRPWGVWLAARRLDLPEATGDYLLGFLLAWALPREPWLLGPLVAGALLVHHSVRRRVVLTAREAEVAWQAAEVARRAAESTALRTLDRLKDEFLGTVSHELRNPLTVISGVADLLEARRAALGSPIGGMVIHLVTATAQLSRLVDDLLEFTRLQLDLLAVHPQEVDLVPLLRNALAAWRFWPEGTRLVAELPPALPARADPARVAQVLTNLVTNAFKYAPAGPVTLRAALVPAAPGGAPGAVRVEVVDEGPGIPEAEQARIWERFYRGTAPGAVSGLGIGLAVVKVLVEAQGGRVGLTSAPGRGSCFWFEVPAAPAGGAAHAAAGHAAAGHTTDTAGPAA
jgi:signal transduction histidine kinase